MLLQAACLQTQKGIILKNLTLTIALLACGIATAQAAQFSVSGGAVAGNVNGFVIHQTPQGLDGDVLDKSYTGLQASAGVAEGPLVAGINAMKSTGGVDVSDLSASAGYTLDLGDGFAVTPGLQAGWQEVMGESYTRKAATLGVSYAISPEWRVMGSAAVGRAHGARDALMQRGNGDYRAGQIAVSYSPAKIGTFTLAATEQVTQTASLPGAGDMDMRNRAVSLTYSREF